MNGAYSKPTKGQLGRLLELAKRKPRAEIVFVDSVSHATLRTWRRMETLGYVCAVDGQGISHRCTVVLTELGKRIVAETNGNISPYPHVGGCEQCRAALVCNYCGTSLLTNGYLHRCTNGRCMNCHGKVCTSGGSTSPGHGYGNSPTNVPHCASAK